MRTPSALPVPTSSGAFNYDSEEQTTPPASWSIAEYFPESAPGQVFEALWRRLRRQHARRGLSLRRSRLQPLLPWMMNRDGSEEETLNHVGRHEFGGSYANPSYRNDPALKYISYGAFNGATYFINGSGGVFHLREDPLVPGMFYASNAAEFSVHAAGDIVRMMGAHVEQPGDDEGGAGDRTAAASAACAIPCPSPPVAWWWRTAPRKATKPARRRTSMHSACAVPRWSTASACPTPPSPTASRKPSAGGRPDTQVNWSGTLWELDPVEVVARAVPPLSRAPVLPAPEQQALQQAGVDQNCCATGCTRRSSRWWSRATSPCATAPTTQQPYNLQVPGGAMTAPTPNAKIYNIDRQQFFQADQIRGYASGKPPQQGGTPSPGRRVLPVPMHDPPRWRANPPVPAGAPPAGVTRSPRTAPPRYSSPPNAPWPRQLVDSSKTGWSQAVVRERNWMSFSPARRPCPACHGVNTQAQNAAPRSREQARGPGQPAAAAGRRVVRNNCPASGGTGAWTYARHQLLRLRRGPPVPHPGLQRRQRLRKACRRLQTQACPYTHPSSPGAGATACPFPTPPRRGSLHAKKALQGERANGFLGRGRWPGEFAPVTVP